MLYVEIDEENCLAILEPTGSLTKSDFVSAAEIIAPYLQMPRSLKGIIIHVKSFPGWNSFTALCAHLEFIRDHHKKIPRVAFSTDSVAGSCAKAVSRHFVSAEVKVFSFDELKSAKEWIKDSKQ
jgi:hypothetical protein